MNIDDVKTYFGNQVNIVINSKNISGIINEISDKYLKLDTDFLPWSTITKKGRQEVLDIIEGYLKG